MTPSNRPSWLGSTESPAVLHFLRTNASCFKNSFRRLSWPSLERYQPQAPKARILPSPQTNIFWNCDQESSAASTSPPFSSTPGPASTPGRSICRSIFFEKVLELESDFGIDITIETVRGRVPHSTPGSPGRFWSDSRTSSSPAISASGAAPPRRLVMNDDPRLLREIAENCWHLHACVGYENGPQVPDPRIPDHAPALESHLKWWESVWTMQAQRGLEAVTVTPVFQPDSPIPRNRCLGDQPLDGPNPPRAI